MLPLDERWYRRLLVVALGLGVAGGIFALVYSLATGWGIRFFFGEPTSEPFSGQWWWVPLISGGAVLVAVLRARTGTTGRIPGAVAYARKGWVEPSTAFQLTAISAISLALGASLGPSFGIIVSAGGLAAWVVSRHKDADDAERTEYALTGMAGGLGAVFAAPVFASVMASELSPTPKRDYVSAFIPQLLAATIGFVIFFGVTGSAILDRFDVPGYHFEYWHLFAAVGLGLLASLVMVAYEVIGNVIRAWIQPVDATPRMV
jgi:H+/Cl- antiporter ClcA